MNATELAAWWGAVIATLVFVWDVYKWKMAGSIINVSVSPNMQTFGGISNGLEETTFIVVEVTNTGDRKTTLTHLIGVHYTSMFNRLRKKQNKTFIVVIPVLSTPLPHVLEPGERWLGGIEQNQELEEMSRSGYLYCGVFHSSSKQPILQRVVVQNAKST